MGGMVKLWYICIMKYYSAMKRRELLIQQLGWVHRELCWVKLDNPKHLHIVWFHLYKIPKRWNYRNGEHNHACQGLRRVWGQEESMTIKKATWRIFVVIEMFCLLTVSMLISWLWYFTIILQDLTIGGTGWRVCRISLHYFWQLHVNLQVSQTKNFS